MSDRDSYQINTILSTPTWEMPEEEDSGLGLSLLDDQSPACTQTGHKCNHLSWDIDKGNRTQIRLSTPPLTEPIEPDSHQFVTTLSLGNELVIGNQCSDDENTNKKENCPPVHERLVGAGPDYSSKDENFVVEKDGVKPLPSTPGPFAGDYDLQVPSIKPSLVVTRVHLVRPQKTFPSGQPEPSTKDNRANQVYSPHFQPKEGEKHTCGSKRTSDIRVVYKPRGLDPVGNMVQQEVLKNTHRDREQDRNQLMNAAFSALSHAVKVNPLYPSARRPARLTILNAAINYIRYLEALLDIYDTDTCDSYFENK